MTYWEGPHLPIITNAHVEFHHSAHTQTRVEDVTAKGMATRHGSEDSGVLLSFDPPLIQLRFEATGNSSE